MKHKWLFSTVAVMAMTISGCCSDCSCNEEYVQQLNDSIATLNKQLNDCRNSKVVSTKRNKKKSTKLHARGKKPAAKQNVVSGDNSRNSQIESTVNMGNNNHNNTIIVNNGTINNYYDAKPRCSADTVKKQRNCTVSGDIKITITRETYVRSR